MKQYPNLTNPLQIGSVTIKNRMFMAPMDTGFGNNEYGGFTEAGVEYFVKRAAGGFGLLYSGGTSVDTKVDGADTIVNHPEEFIATGKKMNERINAYGSKMFMQLSMNVGRNAGLKTPSVLPVLGNPSIKTQALTVEEIHSKVQDVAKAAKVCKEAGYAGVDIHALHWGHLLDTFALEFTNQREDEYGGSLENRLRFAKDIVEAIKAECGTDFPVTIRLAMKSYIKDFDKASFDGSQEVGRTLEEAIEIAKLLEKYGYDALSTDAGMLDAIYYAMPPSYVEKGFTIEMAAKLKEAVSIPILCGGRMADPDMDEAAIAEGKIDAVVIGRQAISDPNFAEKIVKGEPENVRSCIACNQGCIWGYFTKGQVSCAVNPEVGYETNEPLTKSADSKKVIIVGGGVAGMEAAYNAKLRGHEVTLYEKSDVLGGNLIPAGAHDFKAEVNELNEYYKHQMEVLQIDVRMQTEVSAELLKESGADVIILATGSKPIMPNLPGIDHVKTISGVDALLNKKKVGQKVVIVGGGLVGCEIALGYAEEGKNVTIVEALENIMQTGDVPSMNKAMLFDAFEYYHTNIMTSCRVKEINDIGVVVTLADGTEKTIEADTVVMSVGYRSVKSMAEELKNCEAQVFEIGDGNAVGNIMTCISEAYEVIMKL
ncbi:oxidoreductase [Anaeromicropila herbilytica]|uniref:2-enoate reductase n=1 Tax=Anaeromicropila herbilytica TaxID=2785025 RepID=A0A7R7ELM5_9FIRM|nr:FAD-dependent oxidoreductase [Anaeromicropila herbilytica]BCN31047.1 2-enoate reductase [Anaeromicropila herbilytica]